MSPITADTIRVWRKKLFGVWSVYKKSKMGMAGLYILFFFVFLAIFAPFIAPYDPTLRLTSKVSADYIPPSWFRTFDPNPLDRMQVIANPNFTSPTDWKYYEEDAYNQYVSGEYDPDDTATNNPGGSYKITFIDNSTSLALGYEETTPIAYLETTFNWTYNRIPPEIRILVKLKIDAINFTVANLESYVQLIPPYADEPVPTATGSTTEIRLYPSYTTGVYSLTDPPIRLDILEPIFNTTGTIKFRFKFRLRTLNPDPSILGKLVIHVDEVQLITYETEFGLMGTSDFGGDVFSEFVFGAQISLIIGLLATALALAIGVTIGLIAGYYGGLAGEIIMQLINFMLILPGLPLLIVLAAVLGPSFTNLILVIGLVGWPGTAILIRSQVLSEREKAYVEAARAAGASDLYIIFRHILPNVLPLVFVQLTGGVAGAILSESGLAFLGLSDPNITSWGKMLQLASGTGAFSNGSWWYVLFPGLGIAALSLAFVFIGTALDEVLNPKLHEH